MTTYYLDSSENSSNLFSDAISIFDDLAEAQLTAVRFAKEKPDTIFYVREVVEDSKLVYKACASLTIDSEVVNGGALSE